MKPEIPKIKLKTSIILLCDDINGGASKTDVEPTTKGFDPILDRVISDLKHYLSSITISKVENFYKDLSILI